jgi:hypothetical protein
MAEPDAMNGSAMSFLAGSAAPDPVSFLTIAVGAIVGASLRFILYRGTRSAASSRRAWFMEIVLAFGLGLLAGAVFVAGSGPSLSPLGLGVLAALAAYAGTAFAVSWMGLKEAEQTPVVPAAHLLITLFASLAGAAAVMAVAGQF